MKVSSTRTTLAIQAESIHDVKLLEVLGYLMGCQGQTNATNVLAGVHRVAAHMFSEEGIMRQCEPSELATAILSEFRSEKDCAVRRAVVAPA